MKMLNLASGTKVSTRPEVLNIDWSIYLRIRKSRLLRAVSPLLLKGERLSRYLALQDNVMVHDLKKRLPFASSSIDVVYHSHFLEHLDRDIAAQFLQEIRRVLKSGGIHRIVVPDMEKACREYISHISLCDDNSEESIGHEKYIAAIIGQSVRRESFGTSHQKPLRRLLENTLLGDARKRGETHQWMYDRVNLTGLLGSLGYKDVRLQSYNTSLIPDWEQYGLDTGPDGGEHRPGSLYVEAIR